jgi:hypothetical protein
MKSIKKLLLIFLIIITLVSCNNQSSQKKAADNVDDVVMEETTLLISKYPMPTSYEVINSLNESGAGYIFDITNPPENVEKYITYKQKAINLGIFSADLMYSSIYEKKDNTAAYLDNFVQLIGALDISNLNQEFFQRVQANLDNKDSLVLIIKAAQYDANKYLKETNKNELALFVLTGSWIEGTYLVSEAIQFANDKTMIYKLVIKNRQSLVDLIKLMENFKDQEDFKDLYASLVKINNLFDIFEKNTSDTKNVENLKREILSFRNSLI